MLAGLIGCGACALATGGAYYGPHVMRYSSAQALKQLAVRTRSLVLTYDDGPGTEATPEVAARLAAHNCKATFFLLGRNVDRNPEIIDQLKTDGQELACHTYGHTNSWKVLPWTATSDINHGYDAISRWVGADGYFRPPYGRITLATLLALRQRRARTVWWTIDSGDTWARLPRAIDVVEQVKRVGGGVVLMHDFDRSADRVEFVCEVTELLLDSAHREGLNICTVGDLFRKAI